MKNALLIILFCLISKQSIWAQMESGTISYKVKADKIMIDSILETQESQNLSNYLEMMFKHQIKTLPYLTYQLQFNRSQSIFQKNQTMSTDNGLDLDRTAANLGVKGIYYTDLEKNKAEHQIDILGKDYLIFYDINDFNWKLSEETKVIKGYLCYKATAEFKPDFGKGGTATAWFTKEIPFQFGPAFYSGLPGLILELKQGYYTFYVDNINLLKKNQKIKRPTKGKEVAFEDWVKEYTRLKLEYAGKR